MAKKGDFYIATLGETHLGWGTHRYTDSRPRIYNECYIPIPSLEAQRLELFNSNHSNPGLGINEFNFSTSDGFMKGVLKSSGNNSAGEIHAKNLHGSGNLKLLGPWFAHINANPGDRIMVEFTSPTDIILTKI